jgi:hypothetical protein
MAVTWNVYGKIKTITKGTASPYTYMEFTYDGAGNRVRKSAGTITTEGVKAFTDQTTYIRDASGNIMATYESQISQRPAIRTAGGSTISYTLQTTTHNAEYPMYGSSRLGVYRNSTYQYDDVTHFSSINLTSGTFDFTPIVPDPTLGNNFRQPRQKVFELSDHLGNVMAVISDWKWGVNDGSNNFKYYAADVQSAQDYYPFGMISSRGWRRKPLRWQTKTPTTSVGEAGKTN